MKPLGKYMDESEWTAFSNEVTFIGNLCRTTPDYYAATYTYLRAVATINDIFKTDPDVEFDFQEAAIATKTKAVEELGYIMYAALTKGKNPFEEFKKDDD